jgi:hypothetical protein
MKTQILTVTKELADKMLESNTTNREVRPANVEKYVKILKAGEWKLTHQGIAFDTDGKLVDGQHRLMAISQTGIEATMMVTHGVDPETFMVLDQGARRNAADILHLNPRVAEVINLAARVLTHEQSPSPASLKKMEAAIRPIVERLMAKCNLNAIFFSSAAMKLGAVSRVLLGEDEDYVFNLYAQLCRSEVDQLPPVAAALVKAHLQGRTSAVNKNQTMAQALYVFTRSNANFKQLRIDTAGAGDVIRFAIATVYGR